jgi:thymidine phosphorylase
VAGAIDSLATLPGYNASLPTEDFLRVLGSTRLAHIGHSARFAPADRTLWDLRGRVDGAKEEPLLIAASLLGKKLATGTTCGSIDVRVGPAGNAGHTAEAALETSWAIVSAAWLLGMRVSCVLADATRLPWPRLGRLDAILSIWEILTDAAWHDHPHVRFCREVAAAACHAANPLIDLGAWRERVAQSLRSGQGRATFEASIEGHGAQPDAVEQVRRRAESRTDVPVPCEGQPEPRSITAFFKSARGRMRPEAVDALGLSWRQQEQMLVVHVPPGEDEAALRELAASVRSIRPASPVVTSIVRFEGGIEQADKER